MKLTPQKQAKFLSVLAEGWSVTKAAKAIGVTTQGLYSLRARDVTFSDAWDRALEEGTDTLEDEMRIRAMGSSDTLMIFTLKARRPEKYRDRVDAQITGRLTLEALVGAAMQPKAEA